jgi:hypothetical protein
MKGHMAKKKQSLLTMTDGHPEHFALYEDDNKWLEIDMVDDLRICVKKNGYVIAIIDGFKINVLYSFGELNMIGGQDE